MVHHATDSGAGARAGAPSLHACGGPSAVLVVLVVVAGDVDVEDVDVDLDDLQARHRLHRVGHMGPDLVGEFVDRDAVLDLDVDVDRGLLLPHLHLHAASSAGGSAHASRHRAYRLGRSAAHRVHSLGLADGDSGDGGHHAVRDGGPAARLLTRTPARGLELSHDCLTV